MSSLGVPVALASLTLAVAASACGGDGAAAPDGGVDAGALPDAGPAGQERWVVPHALAVEFAPAIAPDGTILVHGQPDFTPDPADMDPSVLAVSPAGQLVWTARTEVGAIDAPPAIVVDGTIYIASTNSGADDSTLHRFALADGAPGATDTFAGTTIFAPAIAADGTIYLPNDALNAVGTAPWSFPLADGGKSGSNAAIGPSGTIYLGARGLTNHNLYAVNANGSERWHRDLGAAVVSPIAIDDRERIYVVNGDGLLAVYDAAGDLAWSHQLPSFNSGGGMVLGADGTVYVGTLATDPSQYAGDWMFAIKEGTGGQGDEVWRISLGDMITTTPALSAGGTLYVTDSCRTLHALDAATGATRWTFDEPNTPEGSCAGFSAPALGADGTVYVSSEGPAGDLPGGLHAITGDGTGPAATPWPVESGDPAHTGRVE